ncbi:MAG: hypothetical protein ACKEQK_00300 [Candidatus Hodgkinia cicadicola]
MGNASHGALTNETFGRWLEALILCITHFALKAVISIANTSPFRERGREAQPQPKHQTDLILANRLSMKRRTGALEVFVLLRRFGRLEEKGITEAEKRGLWVVRKGVWGVGTWEQSL